MKRRTWTICEVGLLRQMATTCTSIEIAAALGRSPVAVRKAAQRFGVSIRDGKRGPRKEWFNQET